MVPGKTDPALSRTSIQNIFGTPFIDGNKVTLLMERDSFTIIFDAVRGAKKLICLAFYIFRNDETGNELAEILRRKVAEGVKVYVLYDHFGSIGTPAKFWEYLRDSGIGVRASHPFKWTSPFHYAHRDHRKLIIIDGRYAFTGGLYIANEYSGYRFIREKLKTKNKKKGWRDTGIFLEGPIAAALFAEFRKSWQVWKGGTISSIKTGMYVEGGLPALPIFASSAKGRRKMRKLLYYSIGRAQKSIYLTTAYFTPSRRMLQILEDAVARGVDVKLLLPGRSDISAALYAARAYFTRLIRAGVEIYNYRGEILHAKTAVFDGIWSIIGSANLDFQSLRRNDEGNVGIVDEDFGTQMSDVFFDDLKNSERVDLGRWLKRPFCEKSKERFFSLFRRRL
jgi:cardiolipin synthase